MPQKQLKKTSATEKPHSCQDGSTTETPELDPTIDKAMEVMTANITSVIDDKLKRMFHSINTNISQYLKETSCPKIVTKVFC